MNFSYRCKAFDYPPFVTTRVSVAAGVIRAWNCYTASFTLHHDLSITQIRRILAKDRKVADQWAAIQLAARNAGSHCDDHRSRGRA